MSNISMQATVSLQQAAKLIVANPNARFLLEGEPGIGKTSIVGMLQDMTGMDAAIMSVPDMDLGDVCMPVIHHESKTTRYYPNARFKLQEGKPVIICLDEYSKGVDPVKNMLHPMLETFRPRLGDIPIPEGSLIFLTGNLATDGVGDSLKAHSRQRVIKLTIRKPDAEGWNKWAMNKGTISPIVMGWVARNPHALASYTDGDQKGNPFIFNPKAVQDGCVSPRTLEIVSGTIAHRDGYDSESLHAAMAGAVGAPAAESITSFIRHHDSLPSWASILASPATAKIPKDPGALAVLVFGALEKVEKDTIAPIMEYLGRVDEEWQCLFAVSLARHESKNRYAFGAPAFAKWVQKNSDLL